MNKDAKAVETVNHPSHYNEHPSKIECVDIAEDLGFLMGNAYKYVWRAGLKDPSSKTEDLKKAIWYLRRFKNRKIGCLRHLLDEEDSRNAEAIRKNLRKVCEAETSLTPLYMLSRWLLDPNEWELTDIIKRITTLVEPEPEASSTPGSGAL